jgi:hypothetical protein
MRREKARRIDLEFIVGAGECDGFLPVGRCCSEPRALNYKFDVVVGLSEEV